MATSPGQTTGQTNIIPTLTSMTTKNDVTLPNSNDTATDVTPLINSTAGDGMSVVNVTTADVISTLNVTDVDDLISFVNDTLNTVNVTTSNVIPTLNITISDILSAMNDTMMSTVGASDYFNSTNTTSPPTTQMTSGNSSGNTSTPTMATTKTLEQDVADMIDFWVPPFLFFIGIVANILVIMVMQSKDFRHISTSFYMSVSSIVDMASLLVSLPAHYLYVNFPHVFDSARNAHAMCSFFNLFGWGSSDLGVLLTVAMTTERSLAIQFPLRAPTLCTVKRAKIVTVCLFLLEILKVGHLVFTSRVASVEVTSLLCVVDLTSDETYAIFYTYYWPYIHNIFLLVAFIIIIIGNIIITVHVKRSEDSKEIGEGNKRAGGGKGGKMASKSRQLSLMLIIDSATIVICTLPFSIYVLVDQAFKLFDDSPQERGESSLIFAIVFYLLYVNRCANFFLYCVSGARFRQTLKDILTGNSQKRKKNYITGATNTRNVTSSTFTTEGEGGNRVSMNPLGSAASSAEMNGESNRISTISVNTLGSSTARNGKLERHYGYGKTQNGK